MRYGRSECATEFEELWRSECVRFKIADNKIPESQPLACNMTWTRNRWIEKKTASPMSTSQWNLFNYAQHFYYFSDFVYGHELFEYFLLNMQRQQRPQWSSQSFKFVRHLTAWILFRKKSVVFASSSSIWFFHSEVIMSFKIPLTLRYLCFNAVYVLGRY